MEWLNNIIKSLQGAKTVLAGLATSIVGLVVGLGFLTPDVADQLAKLIMEFLGQLIGLLMTAVGILAILLRLGMKTETEKTVEKVATPETSGPQQVHKPHTYQ